MSPAAGFVGYRAAADGAVTITGPGSTWDCTGGPKVQATYVGEYGRGEITVSDGASLITYNTILGKASDSSGMVTVTGAGSSWADAPDQPAAMTIGREGAGTLVVAAGGAFAASQLVLGEEFGSTGTLTVTGAGSTLVCDGVLDAQGEGTVRVVIEGGAQVTTGGGRIGAGRSGSSSQVLVTGAGTVWRSGEASTDSTAMLVGQRGRLDIEQGAAVHSGTGRIAYNDLVTGPQTTVTVTGADSRWIVTNEIDVLSARLTVVDGAVVQSTDGTIGWYSTTGNMTSGLVAVSGAGSRWDLTGDLQVGDANHGQLSVSDGAVVSSQTGRIGGRWSLSRAIIEGAGSQWNTADRLSVGPESVQFPATPVRNELILRDGARVTSGSAGIGDARYSTGAVNVCGSGSTWTVAGDVTMGLLYTGSLSAEDCGRGELCIARGGTVAVGQNLTVNHNSLVHVEVAAGRHAIRRGRSDQRRHGSAVGRRVARRGRIHAHRRHRPVAGRTARRRIGRGVRRRLE